MKKISKAFMIFAVVWMLFVQAQFLRAAEKKTVPKEPVPSQILNAKKVFIANAGADEIVPGQATFTGGPDRCYNEFYYAMKNAGHYQIVDSPGEADLVLEVGVDAAASDPLFRLTIRDPRTNVILWGFKVRIEFGAGQANSDRNFDQAINRLVFELQALVTRASS